MTPSKVILLLIVAVPACSHHQDNHALPPDAPRFTVLSSQRIGIMDTTLNRLSGRIRSSDAQPPAVYSICARNLQSGTCQRTTSNPVGQYGLWLSGGRYSIELNATDGYVVALDTLILATGDDWQLDIRAYNRLR